LLNTLPHLASTLEQLWSSFKHSDFWKFGLGVGGTGVRGAGVGGAGVRGAGVRGAGVRGAGVRGAGVRGFGVLGTIKNKNKHVQ